MARPDPRSAAALLYVLVSPACASTPADPDAGGSDSTATAAASDGTAEPDASTTAGPGAADATSTASAPGDDATDGGTSGGDATADGPADGSADGSGSEGTTGDAGDGCTPFPPSADFAAPGPFEVVSEAPDGCRVFRPAALGEGGLEHPIIVWGNGTSLTVEIYQDALEHWASHGFIVAAATTSNAGTGAEMLACLDWVTAQADDPASAYADRVDRTRVGATGHSQGGGGSLMAGTDPRITVTAPLQPYTEQGWGGYDQASQSMQTGPMFLMSGDADTISPPNPNQQRVFDDTNVATLWGTLAGGNHLFSATGDIDGYRGPSTAWFRYHLMCDELARPLFYDACTLCEDADWDVQTKNW